MILYFSGTGNSKYIAQIVADKTGDKLFSINDSIKQDTHPEIADELVIFVVPVYSWRIPRVVEQWVQSTPSFAGKKCYFLVTCGNSLGNAQKYARRFCEQQHMTYMGCAEIVMPENYIVMFKCPPEDECVRMIERATQLAHELADKIRACEPIPDKEVGLVGKIESCPINPLFYCFCVSSKKFYVKDSCTGCGLCEQLCPVNCVHIESAQPVWGQGCTHCMACISFCPVEAIEYGKATAGKRRYIFSK